MATKTDQPSRKMTAAEFLPWAEAAQARGEPRYELIDGVPIPMSPERSIHGQTKLAVAIALLAAVQRAGINCHVQPDGATVVAGNHKVYGPDALVYCGEVLPGDATVTPNPVILVEVISPSTGHIDKGDKLEAYFGVPSVHHCLLVYPDRRLVVHHQRAAAGDKLATQFAHEGDLRLDPPGLTVPVVELLEVPVRRLG
jgi:Uma2 family endonuclease